MHILQTWTPILLDFKDIRWKQLWCDAQAHVWGRSARKSPPRQCSIPKHRRHSHCKQQKIFCCSKTKLHSSYLIADWSLHVCFCTKHERHPHGCSIIWRLSWKVFVNKTLKLLKLIDIFNLLTARRKPQWTRSPTWIHPMLCMRKKLKKNTRRCFSQASSPNSPKRQRCMKT